MVLTPSNQDLCLFSGIIDDDTAPATPRNAIHVGLYVGDFFFFSKLDAEESRFKKILNDKVATDFMGDAYIFLRSYYE